MLKNYLKTLVDILFPRLCFFCGKKIEKEFLCRKCEGKIQQYPGNTCRLCGKLISKQNTTTCPKCEKTSHPWRQIIIASAYQEPLITLVHHFKYKNCDYLDSFLADLVITKAKKYNLTGYELVTSVPIHKAKLKKRGYNQSELLGKKIANYFKIPFYNDIIYERHLRRSQTKLTGQERVENSRGAFGVKKDISGKTIILVDDIFTTGATISSCAGELKRKGAKEVMALTLAKKIR